MEQLADTYASVDVCVRTAPPAMCREVLERYTKHNTISRQALSGSPEAGPLSPIELRVVAGESHERDAVGH